MIYMGVIVHSFFKELFEEKILQRLSDEEKRESVYHSKGGNGNINDIPLQTTYKAFSPYE